MLLLGVLVAVLLRSFLLEQFFIQGPSMEPTLKEPSRVLVEKITGGARDVTRGDVVVFHQGSGSEARDLIKRVIGLPGDRVAIRDCIVYLNNAPLRESYVASPTDCGTTDMEEVVVAAGRIFVLGDNRAQSSDSRFFGTVALSRVIGRAAVVIWPPSRWGTL